jgi:hypothetical protein
VMLSASSRARCEWRVREIAVTALAGLDKIGSPQKLAHPLFVRAQHVNQGYSAKSL